MKRIVFFISGFSLVFLGTLSCFSSAQNSPQILLQQAPTASSTLSAASSLSVSSSASLYQIHKLLSYGHSFLSQDIQDFYLSNLKVMKELLDWDVIDVLSFSLNRQADLSSFLYRSDDQLSKASSLITYLSEEVARLQDAYTVCETAKLIADKSYANGITLYSSSVMETSLSDALRYGTCMTQKRIASNAKKVLLSKLVFYHDTLLKKYTYLEKQQFLLVDHFDLIKDNVLQELVSLKKTIDNYSY